MKKGAPLVVSILLLDACSLMPDKPTGVERMYVIDCGENHVKDLSRWTPGANVGKAHVFGNHCYLIKHTAGWMLWDTGNPDRLAALPDGLSVAGGRITAYMKKPLAESLREIGVSPADIAHVAMSHVHGDHAGNASLFAASTIYLQAREADAMFGPAAQKFGFAPEHFEPLKPAKLRRLNGEHDVFGDGTVTILPAPGHSPGHQVLVAKLPKTGPVMLSGDLVHLQYNWERRLAPSFNADVAQSIRSMDAMKAYLSQTGTRLWINHDREQHASIPKAPAFVE